LLLAYACSKNIKVYQMDVKSSSLNGELEEEVHIEQPEGFQLSENAYCVCKLKKSMYGLKQALRAWYSRLDKYLQQTGFRKGSANNNCCPLTKSWEFLGHVDLFWDFDSLSKEERKSKRRSQDLDCILGPFLGF
jgi:hypothetical protein